MPIKDVNTPLSIDTNTQNDWLNKDENFNSNSKVSNKTPLDSFFLNDTTIQLTSTSVDTLWGINIEKNTIKIIFSNKNITPLLLKNTSKQIQIIATEDLNQDGFNELIVVDNGTEGCWDRIQMYAYVKNKWTEKFNRITYGCGENGLYKIEKKSTKLSEIITYGISEEQIDTLTGDTLENIIPTAIQRSLIKF